MSDAPTTTVYTDGACQGNPGPGGWAWAVPGGAYRSGAAVHTTNQRMELQAVLDAVTAIAGPLLVVSDSTYVVNCFKARWWESWERKGWKNSQRQDVANQDLWRPLVAAYKLDPARIEFRWVKGHSNDPGNDLVDRLAVEAAATQEGREGHGRPEQLGPADDPVGRRRVRGGQEAAAAPAPGDRQAGGPAGETPDLAGVAHRLYVSGLGPAGLGGYDDTATPATVRRRLAEILAAKAETHPDLVVTTGLALGAGQLAAEAAADAGVPYVAVLAFPAQERRWSQASREKHALLLAGAKEIVVVDQAVPEGRAAAGAAIGRRDAWLAAHADEAVIVWDGVDRWVGHHAGDLRRALGDEQVWVLEP